MFWRNLLPPVSLLLNYAEEDAPGSSKTSVLINQHSPEVSHPKLNKILYINWTTFITMK
jgi:hypothetical protein